MDGYVVEVLVDVLTTCQERSWADSISETIRQALREDRAENEGEAEGSMLNRTVIEDSSLVNYYLYVQTERGPCEASSPKNFP